MLPWFMHGFLLLFLLAGRAEAMAPVIHEGTLDLRSWDAAAHPAFPLQGTTEFFWQQFIQSDGIQSSPTMIPIPGGWNHVGPFPVQGYASYRFHVLLRDRQRLSFYFPPFWSAYRIFIDGELIKSSGVAGKDTATSAPYLGDFLEYTFEPKSTAFDVVFEISNFDLFQGGATDHSYLGLPEAVQHRTYRMLGWAFFLIGTLVIMAFYHFGLYFLRRSDRSTLYYGLLCVGVALHMVVGDPSDAIGLIFPVSFWLGVLIYNLSWSLSIVSFTHYCARLFPQHYSLKLARVFAAISFVFAMSIIWMTTPQIMKLTAIYQILCVAVALYSIVCIGTAALRKREGARIFLVSIIVLMGSAMHDMFLRQHSFTDVSLSGFGLFLFTFCQSYMLSARFSKAFHRAETSEAGIRYLNQHLESKVEEQTREIKSIMKHIKLGIFTIEGQPSIIGRDYSRHLEELLQKKDLNGAEALPLLLHSSQLTKEAQQQVESALCASFGEQAINFELNEDLFPRQILWEHPQLGERVYDLTWNPITTSEDKIEKILVTLGDVTELKNMEKQTRDLRSELKIVAEILNVKEDDFRRFVKISRSFLEQNSNLADAADPNLRDAEALKVIFMNLHTLKGVARTLEFRQLSDMIHTMEQFYSKQAKQEVEDWEPAQIKQDMQDLAQHIAEYEHIAQNKLGRFLDESARLIMPAPEALASFSRLATMLGEAHPDHAKDIEPLFDALQRTLFVPLRDTMQDIFRSTRALAKDLEKPEPEVFLDIPQFQISTATDEALRHSFLHLLRNAMDHGIEKPKDRLLAGKAAAGLIQLRMEKNGDVMRLAMSDDGRGLDLYRLKATGIDRGLLKPDEETSWVAIARLIFATGVSTARSVTGISGRGVGMPAVARFIEDIGGQVRIELFDEQPDGLGFIPFQVVIELPMNLFLAASSSAVKQGAA